jgi:hypothetical protein
VADVRTFSLAPRKFFTRCGGHFLFLPELARLDPGPLAQAARLPCSKMIPPAHALRACLALKLWSIARKSALPSCLCLENSTPLNFKTGSSQFLHCIPLGKKWGRRMKMAFEPGLELGGEL